MFTGIVTSACCKVKTPLPKKKKKRLLCSFEHCECVFRGKSIYEVLPIEKAIIMNHDSGFIIGIAVEFLKILIDLEQSPKTSL